MRPITDVLIEFPRRIPAEFPAVPGAPNAIERGHARTDAAARDEAIAEARRLGVEEGRAVAEREGVARLEAQSQEHATTLTAARATWAAHEGDALARQMREGFATLEGSIAAALAAVMAPVLAAAVRVRAADAIRAAIADLVSGGHGALIEVSGPSDLVEALRAAFADQTAVVISAADVAEVSARAGDTVVTTQIEAWANRLQAALEEPA